MQVELPGILKEWFCKHSFEIVVWIKANSEFTKQFWTQPLTIRAPVHPYAFENEHGTMKGKGKLIKCLSKEKVLTHRTFIKQILNFMSVL